MMERNDINFKDNCFDVIHLGAAFWVLFAHTIAWVFYYESPSECTPSNFPLWRLISPGPAVSIFFFISAFLCAASYERSLKGNTLLGGVKSFWLKRFMRIFPPYILVVITPTFLWLLASLLTGESYSIVNVISKTLTGLFFGSSGWLPEGIIANGSLWYVPVQIQLYLLTPVLVYASRKLKWQWAILLFSALLLWSVFNHNLISCLEHNKIACWVYKRFCFPYIWIYYMGILAYRYREYVLPYLQKHTILLISVFVMFVGVLDVNNTYYLQPIRTILICLFVCSIAYKFGKVHLAVEPSFGIFLWHMPIVSVFMHIWGCQPWLIYVIWFVAILLGYIQCKYVEPIFRKL